MSLDISKLDCVKNRSDRTTAACPACREQGGDKKGDHLVIWPDGKFGCVAYQDDPVHRSRIYAIAGRPDEKESHQAPKTKKSPSWQTPEAAAAGVSPFGYELSAVYRYGDFAAVARYESNDGEKTFRQFHRDGDEWKTGSPAQKWPLYGSIDKSSPFIFVCEGEKAQSAAARIGLNAVCSAGGSAAAPKSDWSALAGMRVAILPDNDAAGRKYASQVAIILASLDPPAFAKTIALPDIPDAGDIVDYIDARQDEPTTQICSDITEMARRAFDRRKETSPQNAKGGGPKPTTKLLADQFAQSLGVPFPLRKHRGAWYKFDGRAYFPFSADDLKSAIIGFLRAHAEDHATKNMVANIAENLVGTDLGGVESRIEMPCWLPSGKQAKGWMNMTNSIVNVNALADKLNGNLVLDGDITRQHAIDFFSTYSVPYAYDPNATCPLWNAYLLGVQPDPEMRDILQMAMGLCLVPDTSYEVFFVLYGEGGCGKSVFMHTLEHVVGKENVCTLPLSKFSEKHSAHILTENLVNIVGDLPTSDGSTSLKTIEGILKDAVTGGLIACERKNQEPYEAHAVARCFFATNSLPAFADRTDGVWDRLRVIPFDQKFRGTDRQNPHLREQIVASELPGVFNWAVAGLAKLRKLRSFPHGPRGTEEQNRHRLNCDHESQFLLDKYEQRNGSFVEGQEIYNAYRQFCADSGYKPKNAVNFATELRRIFPSVVDHRKRVNGILKRVFLNIEPSGVFCDEDY